MPGLKRSGVMILEERRMSKEELKEVANVCGMINKLYKNPKAELRNILGGLHLMIMVGWICLWLVVFVPVLYGVIRFHGVKGGFELMLFCLYFLVFWALYVYIYYINPYQIRKKMYRKMLKATAKMAGKLTILLNEEGVFLQTDGITTSSILWDKLGFVRFFPNCIFFFPREKRGTIIMMSKYHEQPVREFLSIYHSDIPIY